MAHMHRLKTLHTECVKLSNSVMNPSGHAALSFNPYGANKSLDEHQWMALSLITALIPFSHTIQLMNTN